MVLIAIVGILAVGSYIVQQFQKSQTTTVKGGNVPDIPRGVNAYAPIAVPNRGQQLLAYRPANSSQTTPGGYSPPLGPYENQPSPTNELLGTTGGGFLV